MMSNAGSHLLLFLGLAIFAAVGLTVLLPNLMPTARGRLNRQRRELRYRHYQYLKAEQAAQKSETRYRSLQAKAQTIRPLTLQESRDHAEDMKTMMGHAKDKVMVAENHLRRTILEEYPPAKQQDIIAKFLQTNDIRVLPFGF